MPHGEIPLVPARSAARSNRSLLGRTYITSTQQFDKNSFGGCPLFADPVREMFMSQDERLLWAYEFFLGTIPCRRSNFKTARTPERGEMVLVLPLTFIYLNKFILLVKVIIVVVL